MNFKSNLKCIAIAILVSISLCHLFQIENTLFLVFLSILFFLINRQISYFTDISPSKQNLSDKVVIITGSSSGIGEQLAYQYSSYGCNLVLSAIGLDLLIKVKQKCIKLGAKNVIIIDSDLTLDIDCKRTVEQTINEFGRIDILHLNHGRLENKHFLGYKNFEDLSFIQDIFDCNYMSFIKICQMALPHLLSNKNKTYIGVTCSGGTAGPLPFDANYVATKNALRAFFSSLRTELSLISSNPGTSITIMYPGAIKTSFTIYHPKLVKTASLPIFVAKSFVNALINEYKEVYYPRNVEIAFWLSFLFPKLYEYIVCSIGYLPKRPDCLKIIENEKCVLRKSRN